MEDSKLREEVRNQNGSVLVANIHCVSFAN